MRSENKLLNISRVMFIIFMILYLLMIIIIILGITLMYYIFDGVNLSSNINQIQLRFIAILPNIILIIVFPIAVYLILKAITKDYCFKCRKIIHPILKKHKCNISTLELEEKNFIAIYKLSEQEVPYINKIVEGLKNSNITRNDREDSIIWYDLMTINALELTNNYKLPLILMGSILEFILIRYCENKNIQPEEFIDVKGKKHQGNSFSNYL